MFSYLTSKFSDLYNLSEPLFKEYVFKSPAPPESNSWGNVYLCVQKKDTLCRRFKCIKFDSYESANEHFHKNYKNKDLSASTMMPICKYTPLYFHPYFLRRKLSNLFINVQM